MTAGPLDGKLALVTGGSRGIGRAVVERLARDGARVAFGYTSDDEAARALERAVTAAGGNAGAVRADLATEAGVCALIDGAQIYLDGLDLLVNNAASSFTPGPIAETDLTEYDRVMAVNTRAVFLLTRHAARRMNDRGRIVTISSLNTIRPVPGTALYTATKGAVEQFAMVAAHELGGRGITVNTVRPGTTDTDLLRSSIPPEVLATLSEATALGRLGQPADIADVVAFLCGPDGRWVTGQHIAATGGLH